MKLRPATSAAYWVSGTLVAFVGVAVARLLAPCLAAPERVWVTVGGQLLGSLGLFVIALGVRRRLRRAASPGIAAGNPSRKPLGS